MSRSKAAVGMSEDEKVSYAALMQKNEELTREEQQTLFQLLLKLPLNEFYEKIEHGKDDRRDLKNKLSHYNLYNIERKYNQQHGFNTGVKKERYRTEKGTLHQIQVEKDGVVRTLDVTRNYSLGSERITSFGKVQIVLDTALLAQHLII